MGGLQVFLWEAPRNSFCIPEDLPVALQVMQDKTGCPRRLAAAGAGMFIGDGAGIGKGRQIAGVILDNFARGRRRAVRCHNAVQSSSPPLVLNPSVGTSDQGHEDPS